MKRHDSERTLPDASARRSIRENLDVTMMVEAAAGTGKTTSLVDRMVGLVRSGRAEVDTMAAITFTLKAAAQLRERFQEGLETAVEELTADQGDGGALSRLQQAMARLDRCFIGTTHAFCARLLRERPVEAGVDPDFEELDETDTRFLANRFFERWLDRAAAAGEPRLAALREIGLPATKLKDPFRKLSGFPDVTFRYAETERPDLDHALNSVLEFLVEVDPHMPRNQARPDPFVELMTNLKNLRDSSVFDDEPSKAAFLEEANHKSRKPTQRDWADKNVAIDFRDRYTSLAINTIAPAVRRWKEHIHGVALSFLEPAVREFSRERLRNGTLTFEDLLVAARDLLRDHSSVRRYFQRRFTHILVDEFQDTDPLQAEVMLYLTGEQVEEKEWRRLRPRPGALFIVGDPKQSIYRFRRADITTYLDVRRQIAGLGGEIVQLSTNFRSLPPICNWINSNFESMFSRDEIDAGRQAAHVPLTPFHQGLPDGLAGTWQLDTALGRRKEEIAAAEVACLVSWIRRAVDGKALIDDEGNHRPLQWRDILLVSWQRPRLSLYARALEAAGIPYDVTGGRAFAQSEELRVLMPALQCIVDPDDSVSLAAFLRGPLCGVDDQALYEFARAGGRFSLYSPLPEQADPRIVAAFEMLRTAAAEAHQLPPAATLARLFDRLGVIALAGWQDRGGTRSGNLLLALAFARKISSRGASLAEVVAELEDLRHESSEVEEMDIDPSRENAVRLMNLHQVKGLEAPIVFLIDPVEPFVFPVDSYIDRTGSESIASFALFPEKGGRKQPKPIGIPEGWDDLQLIEKSFKDAEKKRLLYVAATRARNMLVVGVHSKSPGKLEGPWSGFAVGPSKPLSELKLPEAVGAVAASAETAGNDVLAAEFEKGKNAIAASFDRARHASYSVLPITRLAHRNHAELLRHEEGLGKGTSWGRVMHRLLEAMLRTPKINVELYARNLLKDEERDAADLADVLAAIRAIESSDFWARARRSPRRLVEVPFALQIPARKLGLDEPGNTLLHGTIDLVFREADRWMVVDYKSDIIGNRFDALIEYYRPQVEHYARFWSRLTGEPSQAGLFFIDGTREVWL